MNLEALRWVRIAYRHQIEYRLPLIYCLLSVTRSKWPAIFSSLVEQVSNASHSIIQGPQLLEHSDAFDHCKQAPQTLHNSWIIPCFLYQASLVATLYCACWRMATRSPSLTTLTTLSSLPSIEFLSLLGTRLSIWPSSRRIYAITIFWTKSLAKLSKKSQNWALINAFCGVMRLWLDSTRVMYFFSSVFPYIDLMPWSTSLAASMWMSL